jgi:ATP-binding protein involved in chromosome partitioning
VAESLEGRVTAALAGVRNPRLDNDLLSAGMIRDLAVQDDGSVSFTFLLSPEDPATLVRQARSAVQEVEGVKKDGVKIAVSNPSGPARVTHGPPSDQPNLGRIIAISSGKGGVGKSTVAANLAITLAEAGHRVGVMDADIYGPNIPLMMGFTEKPELFGNEHNKIIPLMRHGLKIMSIGFFLGDDDSPVIWRGPMVHGAINQFLRDVEWGELDYLLVDLPPGTGDAPLSLSQLVPVAGVVIVTTPQDVALQDVVKGIAMFERLQVPIAGVIENMSYFCCPHCDQTTEIFGQGGGQRISEKYNIPLLGRIPLDVRVREAGDQGLPVVLSAPDSPLTASFRSAAEQVAASVSRLAYQQDATPIQFFQTLPKSR